jgi:putative DNA primase/helicase
MSKSNTRIDATNKWPGIFNQLGIDVGDGRHTVCPICGKKNFRFDDKDGCGSWICTCGNGDGWELVKIVLGCDFKEALDQVRPIIGTVAPSAICGEKKASPDILRKMFIASSKATPSDPVGRYLRMRGLQTIPEALRYIPACWESETKKEHPTMLAVVSLPDGTAVTMHRTYLGHDGKKLRVESPKKLMPGLKKATGGAIRLFDPAHGAIGVAEGIETAIACYQLHGIPTWATVSASMMASFVPPIEIKKVYIYGDNDSHKSYAGQAAAYSLAKRLIEVNKMPVEVLIPDVPGDWLDVLNNR